MLQAPMTRWLRMPSPTTGSQKSWWTIAIIVQFFSSMYGGYFGAGNGILVLGGMGLLGLKDIHRADRIKKFLRICINSVAGVGLFLHRFGAWRPRVGLCG